MNELGERIERLLVGPPYAMAPEEQRSTFLELLKDEIINLWPRIDGLRNYLQHWPIGPQAARRLADLPYLPAGVLKAQPPLCLVETSQIKRTLTSSSTTGQSPSRIALDAATSRRMTKGVVAIAQDFLGSARRSYLVVDCRESLGGGPEMGARGAAIRGLQPFASDVTYCLRLDGVGGFELDRDLLTRFAEAHSNVPVLVYGFTYMLWKHLAKPLIVANVCLELPNVHVLHSGGWKRLQDEAVDKQTFNSELARVFHCSADRIVDFYGMVENVGVIYPDCVEGNKHVPAFGEVMVRNPLTLEPAAEGEPGIIQVCSVLPTSFPGQLLLTEDMGKVVAYDGCGCGRRGTCFRFVGRVPKAEIRGCGNIEFRQRIAA